MDSTSLIRKMQHERIADKKRIAVLERALEIAGEGECEAEMALDDICPYEDTNNSGCGSGAGGFMKETTCPKCNGYLSHYEDGSKICMECNWRSDMPDESTHEKEQQHTNIQKTWEDMMIIIELVDNKQFPIEININNSIKKFTKKAAIEVRNGLDEILDKYDKEDIEKDQRIATLEKEIEFLWSGRFSISCNNDNNWKCMSDGDCSVCVEKQAKKEIEREAGDQESKI